MKELSVVFLLLLVVVRSEATAVREAELRSRLFESLGQTHLTFGSVLGKEHAGEAPRLSARWPLKENATRSVKLELLPTLVSRKAEGGETSVDDVCWGMCYTGVVQFDAHDAMFHSPSIHRIAHKIADGADSMPRHLGHNRLTEISRHARGDPELRNDDLWDLRNVRFSALSQNRELPLFGPSDEDDSVDQSLASGFPEWVTVEALPGHSNWKHCMYQRRALHYDHTTSTCFVARVLSRMCAVLAWDTKRKVWAAKRDRAKVTDARGATVLAPTFVGCAGVSGLAAESSSGSPAQSPLADYAAAPTGLSLRATSPDERYANGRAPTFVEATFQLCLDTGSDAPGAAASFLPEFVVGEKHESVNLRNIAAAEGIDVDVVWPTATSRLEAPVCSAPIAGNSRCSRRPHECVGVVSWKPPGSDVGTWEGRAMILVSGFVGICVLVMGIVAAGARW